MKREHAIWILICVLLIGIIILEFIFLGGLDALSQLINESYNSMSEFIQYIKDLIGGLL